MMTLVFLIIAITLLLLLAGALGVMLYRDYIL